MRCWRTASLQRGMAGGRPAPNWTYPAMTRSLPIVPISTSRSASRQPTRLAAPPRTAVIRAGLRNCPKTASVRDKRVAVFLKEDKGPDHDVLAAGSREGHVRVDAGGMERPARNRAVGQRVI